MFMRMLYDDSLSQAAYLIGCQATGEAIVIDPLRDIDQYINLAQSEGLEVVAVADTHIHADYLSGVREFCEQTNVNAYLSDAGDQDWKYEWAKGKDQSGDPYRVHLVKDGDEFKIGNIKFQVIHTPGHTSEHICFLVTDCGGLADEPMGILSGDFIFVGDVGRPDLLESAAGMEGMMEPSARALCKSLQAFSEFDDYLQVWPGHGAGSPCGKALGSVLQSTVGYEKRFNESVKLAGDEDAFVESILSGQPEPPYYFARMKQENRDGVPLLNGLPTPDRVGVRDIPSDAIVIDARDWDSYCLGHLPGSLSMVPEKSFSLVAGAYVEPEQQIVLIADETIINLLIRRLVRVGLDRVVGWVQSDDLKGCDHLEQVEQVSVTELNELENPVVLDVRNASEFGEGHIPNAKNAAYLQLTRRAPEYEDNTRVYVHCRSGIRSARGTSYLLSKGVRAVNVLGGFMAWEEAGLSSVTPTS